LKSSHPGGAKKVGMTLKSSAGSVKPGKLIFESKSYYKEFRVTKTRRASGQHFSSGFSADFGISHQVSNKNFIPK